VTKQLKEGDKAPDFAVSDAEGKRVRLKDLRGKKVVLYFYPKDDTSGCTKEAIVARFDGMTTNFAELAWGRELLTDDFNLDRALTFAQQWTDPGTEPEKTIC